MANVSSSNSHKVLYPTLRFAEFDGEYKMFSVGDFATCYAGATPNTQNKTYWENGTIPWLSSGEVNKKRIFNTDNYITQKGYDSCSTKLIPPHTIVMALAGQGKTRGNVAITEIQLCTNQSLAAMITNASVDAEYLLYYFETQYDNLRAISSGDGTRGGLNLQIIREYKVTLPTLQEQRKVACFLSALDQRIRKQRQLIDALNSYKRGVINDIIVRLSGYEWETLKNLTIDNSIQLKRGNVIPKYKKTEEFVYPVYSSSTHNDGLLGYFNSYMFDEELITWSIDGGGDFFYRPKHKFNVTNVCGIMRLDKARYDYLFCAELLKWQHSRLLFDYQTKAHPSVISDLYSLPTISYLEQNAYSKVFHRLNSIITTETILLEKICSIKKALLQQLFI